MSPQEPAEAASPSPEPCRGSSGSLSHPSGYPTRFVLTQRRKAAVREVGR